MRSNFIQCEFGRLHYIANSRRDDRPNLFLLHGNASSAASFLPMMRLLDNDFNLVALDFPGHGKSEFLNADLFCYYYSMEGLKKVIEIVLAAIGFSNYIAAGNSLGANILAQSMPSLNGLQGLILMASIHSSGKEDFFNQVNPDAPSKLSLKRVLTVDEVNTLTRAFIDASKWDSDVHRLMFEDIFHADGQFREQIVRHMPMQIWPDEIKNLRTSLVPQIYIGGRNDVFIGSEHYRKLSEIVPALESTVYILDHVGHIPHLEDPESCANYIHQFIHALCL
ncbi:alpha/beta fold hydrolase [Undibacterium sp. Dicai25W]|uniref:alpha/beta fold hydrolase n=1 Tax=Undibacterium sp. Dicai25W TaxID=3413034 RepID=UPI003BF42892